METIEFPFKLAGALQDTLESDVHKDRSQDVKPILTERDESTTPNIEPFKNMENPPVDGIECTEERMTGLSKDNNPVLIKTTSETDTSRDRIHPVPDGDLHDIDESDVHMLEEHAEFPIRMREV